MKKLLTFVFMFAAAVIATAAPPPEPPPSCVEWQNQCPPDTRERFNFWMLTSGGNWKNVQYASDWGLAQTVYAGSDVVSTFYSRGNQALYVDQYIFWPVPETGTIYVFDQAAWLYVGELREGDEAGQQIVADYINAHTSKRTLTFWQDVQDAWSESATGACNQATVDAALAGGNVVVAIGLFVYITPVTGPGVAWGVAGLGVVGGNFMNEIRKEVRACQMVPPK